MIPSPLELLEIVQGQTLKVLPEEIIKAARYSRKRPLVGYLPLDISQEGLDFARQFHQPYRLNAARENRFVGALDGAYASGPWIDIHRAGKKCLVYLSSPSVLLGPHSLDDLPLAKKLARKYFGAAKILSENSTRRFLYNQYSYREGSTSDEYTPSMIRDEMDHSQILNIECLVDEYRRGLIDPGKILHFQIPLVHAASFFDDDETHEMVAQFVQSIQAQARTKIKRTTKKIETLQKREEPILLDHLDIVNLPDDYGIVEFSQKMAYLLKFGHIDNPNQLDAFQNSNRDNLTIKKNVLFIDGQPCGSADVLDKQNIFQQVGFRLSVSALYPSSTGEFMANPLTPKKYVREDIAHALSLEGTGVFRPEQFAPMLLQDRLRSWRSNQITEDKK